MERKSVEVLICVLFLMVLSGSVIKAHAQQNLQILQEKNMLSIDADSVKPEEIFSELGKACKISVVTHGDVFSQKKVTIHFKNKPLKEAIKTLVKTCDVKNYIMDFKPEKTGGQKLVKLDLYVAGSGDHVLVQPAEAPQGITITQSALINNYPDKKAGKDSMKTGSPSDKSSFAEGGNFKWDGSAPIAFPEYKGELDYNKSKNTWQDDAKDFSKKTMDILPPAVRDMMADTIIKTADEVAQERGVETITPDITAEAVDRLARQANMPPDVMKNIPKNTNDFNKPRIPISPENLKEQYR